MKKRRTRTLQSAKYLEKKKKRFIVNLSLGLAIAIFSIVLLVFILRLPALQINEVEVSGVKTLDSSEIKLATLAAMDGKYLNLISKNNTLFFSKKNIEEVLKNSFKKIDSINISRESISTLKVEIKESAPKAIVCEGFRQEEDESKCFFVDDEAYIFEKASMISDGVYTKYYINHGDTPISLGNNFIDKNRFSDLQRFVENLRVANISIGGIFIGEGGNYELYVKNNDQSITVVYFDDRTPFEKTSSNFLAFWQSALENKLGTIATTTFDYINLKFGNNVFYTTR